MQVSFTLREHRQKNSLEENIGRDRKQFSGCLGLGVGTGSD